jgi:hypothetical protein
MAGKPPVTPAPSSFPSRPSFSSAARLLPIFEISGAEFVKNGSVFRENGSVWRQNGSEIMSFLAISRLRSFNNEAAPNDTKKGPDGSEPYQNAER